MHRLQVELSAQANEYEIHIGRDLLKQSGDLVRQAIGKATRRLVVISDKNVFGLYGAIVNASLERAGFNTTISLIGLGEKHKSLATLERCLRFLSENRIERSDAIVTLGGGIVGDLAGFAAAIYLRGIRFVQIPTTLLAQTDASIGGKVGINLSDGKNRIGAFHHPAAVIADVDTLKTLPARELTAGWCECIKQGAVGSRKLFSQTLNYLTARPLKEIADSKLEDLIAAHCAFKVSIVKGDERENETRFDHRSRRILNFGHTVAHALEQATSYRQFRHGEAVGYGMLAAGELSKNLGLLDKSELELLRRGVQSCGPLPPTDGIDIQSIVEEIAFDKKRASGQMHWVLIEQIGKARIVGGDSIAPKLLRTSIKEALRSQAKY
ncbi:MAG TPA: 3-dehydroquinate synthase [Pyrinomonadaceae bacterium]|nr:3-dehydroquinate synthase [Pyrinomonadaceae bacterium]